MNMKSDSQFQPKTKEIKTSLWDAADYLETPEDIAHYLEAAFEDGDSSLIAAALGDVARSKGMTAIAAETGLGRESLYKALSLEGNPGFSYVLSVLKALGLQLRPEVAKIETIQSRDVNESKNSGFTLSQDTQPLTGTKIELEHQASKDCLQHKHHGQQSVENRKIRTTSKRAASIVRYTSRKRSTSKMARFAIRSELMQDRGAIVSTGKAIGYDRKVGSTTSKNLRVTRSSKFAKSTVRSTLRQRSK